MTVQAAGAWFCEVCGDEGTSEGAGTAELRRLALCPGCGILVCSRCRWRSDQCLACAPDVGGGHRRLWRQGLALAAVIVAATLALNLMVTRAGPNGGVLDTRGASAPGIETSPSPSAAPGATAATGADELAVLDWTLPTWQDATGAHAGEVVFVVQNRGTRPIRVDPAASRFEVTAASVTFATGAMLAAVPPVLAPGERGYAFGAFVLEAPLPQDAEATATLAAATPDRSTVTLTVRDAGLDSASSPIAATGTVRNDGRRRATDGVVGAVVLDPDGRPMFAFIDTRRAATLRPGERVTFRADDPAIPAGGAGAATVIAAGWATAGATR